MNMKYNEGIFVADVHFQWLCQTEAKRLYMITNDVALVREGCSEHIPLPIQ